jgi:hypothetical protein
MPDGPLVMRRSAAIEVLCRHLGIGCLRTHGSDGYLHTAWGWPNGAYITIRISRTLGWHVTARSGVAGYRMAEVSEPLAATGPAAAGPAAADILAVARLAGLIPATGLTVKGVAVWDAAQSAGPELQVAPGAVTLTIPGEDKTP